ncbi:EF-P lysine aminoacylase EpmA [Ningiella sp. W23]|uniref:EF-P lysine aminoacylase EpmA n=1 Tax=Ningiella sp. W23 TaxID=3023715 RepID=UPI003757F38C
MLKSVRAFFETRQVLEVETPILGQFSVTDPHMDAMSSVLSEKSGQPFYLQTSPEYHMKRLLCAGSGDIFQLSKCFRQDECGSHHNPEFTMLEWYRLGYTMQNLIDEVDEFLQCILNTKPCIQLSYQDAFYRAVCIDPLTASFDDLWGFLLQKGYEDYLQQLSLAYGTNESHLEKEQLLLDSMLQLIFSEFVEPKLATLAKGNKPRALQSKENTKQITCVSHFPASQAALAKVDEESGCALRFEFYSGDVELANGFEELDDPHIQFSRFKKDNQQRLQMQKPERQIDHRFLAALRSQLPACSGVALGIDRLCMIATGATPISDVLSFDIQRA